MADPDSWAFPERLQPHQDRLHFDLQSALQSVVLLRAEIPDDAFTASVLGTERVGHGVVIGNDGLVLTIGYLITEASSIWLTTRTGAVVPGHALAYDHVTGFGLVLPLGNLPVPPMERGESALVGVGDTVTVIGHGGQEHALETRLVARREFAGYWEYLLDEALFTSPPHPHWAGTALVGEDGRLLGIGSLLLQERVESLSTDANMFVPIDLLEPILADMLSWVSRTGLRGRGSACMQRRCTVLSSLAASPRQGRPGGRACGREMCWPRSPASPFRIWPSCSAKYGARARPVRKSN